MSGNARTTRTAAAAAGKQGTPAAVARKRGRSAAAPTAAAPTAPTASEPTAAAPTAPDAADQGTAPDASEPTAPDASEPTAADQGDAAAPTAPTAAAPPHVPSDPTPDKLSAPDSIAQGTIDAYRAADASGKAKIKKLVESKRDTSVRSVDMSKLLTDPASQAPFIMAQQYWQRTLDGLTAPAARKAAPVDYADLLARRVVALRHAADMLALGVASTLPDTLPSDYAHDADDMAKRIVALESAWASDDMTATRKQALAYAGAKIGRSANRNDVGAAIGAAFDGLDVGATLTVAQIITRAAAAGFDADTSWNGRITARLQGGDKGCTVPHVSHAHIGSDRTHGGIRTAAEQQG